MRDCGRVPQERDYDRTYSPCVEIAPAACAGPATDALRKKAEEEVKRTLGPAVELARHPPEARPTGSRGTAKPLMIGLCFGVQTSKAVAMVR